MKNRGFFFSFCELGSSNVRLHVSVGFWGMSTKLSEQSYPWRRMTVDPSQGIRVFITLTRRGITTLYS